MGRGSRPAIVGQKQARAAALAHETNLWMARVCQRRATAGTKLTPQSRYIPTPHHRMGSDRSFPQDATHAHTSTAQVVSTQPQRVGRHPGEHRTPARTTRVNRCTDDVPAPSWNTLGALPIAISQPSDAAPVLGSPEWHVTAACVVEATSKATTATATIWVRGAIVLRAVARTPLSERSSEAQLKNAQGVAKSELNRRNNTPRQVTVPCPHCGVRSNGF